MELTSRIVAFAVALLLVIAMPGVVSAQASQPKTTTPPAPSPPPPAPAAAAAGAPAPPALEPQGYTYDPQGRRDPFVSLLRRGSDVHRASGLRPIGLAGLETSEVTLKGTIASQGTYVGILQGSDNKTYIVKAGDKLLDGTIRVINPESMVIAQQVTDPLSLDKQREVRKLLRQTEEAK
jgi:type IV pilus assembly protein PilP